jgi:uncharacterized RmlC-like cupin family protein
MKKVLVLAYAGLLAQGADPSQPVYWSAAKMKEAEKSATAKLNPERHLGTERMIDSAFIAFRNGSAEPELHEKLADLILVHAGSGTVLIGGKMAGAKSTAPDEARGGTLEGATRYPVSAGDTLYVPAGVPHQFVMEPGQSFTVMVVKLTPKP